MATAAFSMRIVDAPCMRSGRTPAKVFPLTSVREWGFALIGERLAGKFRVDKVCPEFFASDQLVVSAAEKPEVRWMVGSSPTAHFNMIDLE